MIESLPADDAVPSSRYSTSSRSWSQEKFLERSLVSCGNVDTLAATKFDLSFRDFYHPTLSLVRW